MELVAALMLIVPLLVISIYVIAEGVQAYLIYCTVKQASATAARKFAVGYVQDPDGMKDHFYDLCSGVEYPGLVNSYKQFELVDLSEKTIPPTVTIRTSYKPDLYGCKHFPQPDLIGLGRFFEISAQTTKKLE